MVQLWGVITEKIRKNFLFKGDTHIKSSQISNNVEWLSNSADF